MNRIRVVMFAVFSIVCAIEVMSQGHISCDGMRYSENVFSDFKVTKNVKYAEAVTIAGAEVDLLMDVYTNLYQLNSQPN